MRCAMAYYYCHRSLFSRNIMAIIFVILFIGNFTIIICDNRDNYSKLEISIYDNEPDDTVMYKT